MGAVALFDREPGAGPREIRSGPSALDAVSSDRTKDLLALASPFRLINEMGLKMFGQWAENADHPGFDYPVYIATVVGLTLLGVVIMAWRYVPED